MPQPGPQTDAIYRHDIDEIFFGGAVGGGKSDYELGDFAQDVPNYGSAWRGILFRKTYGELEELIQRSQEIYYPWFPGVEWKQSEKTWHWPNGANLKLRYIEHVTDWQRYWGHQYTWIGWDELPLWPDLTAYHKMKARLRSAHDIPNKRIRSSGNPGGAGHLAVKEYFGIDKYPNGGKVIVDPVTGMSRMFIKSRVQDNKILMDSDPGYIDRLKGLGSKDLVKAWLDGNWDVVFGAYFDSWDASRHVIKPFQIPKHWTRIRSFDWGSARPFSVGWYAVSDGERYPAGALIKYREWYGAKGPNEGLKLDTEDVADGILKRETEKIHRAVADPSIFSKDGGPSIADRMAKRKVYWQKADNARVAREGHIGGWDQMRKRLNGEEGKPMLYFFDTCVDSIRTIPALQHDELRPEDVDTNGEDHAADETRYACMARPWVKTVPPPLKKLDSWRRPREETDSWKVV